MHLSKSNIVGRGRELSMEIQHLEMHHSLAHMGVFTANAVSPPYSRAFCVLGVASNFISRESQYKPIGERWIKTHFIQFKSIFQIPPQSVRWTTSQQHKDNEDIGFVLEQVQSLAGRDAMIQSLM